MINLDGTQTVRQLCDSLTMPAGTNVCVHLYTY